MQFGGSLEHVAGPNGSSVMMELTNGRKRGDAPDDAIAQLNAQMRRIEQSPDFEQSKRLRRFLRFIVAETLAGREQSLKEYSVALEVFDRDESFDPQTNSIVRVEASRLRAKLKQYYATAGAHDPIRIELPSGGYVPTFRAAPAPSEARSNGQGLSHWRRTPWLIAAAGALVLVGSAIFLSAVLRPAPDTDRAAASVSLTQTSIAVLPLRNLSGEPDQDFFSDGITDALIARLAKERLANVISTTSVMAYKNADRNIAEIASELGVSHVIEGSVLLIGNKVRITAQLVDAATGQNIWADSYDRDVADVLAIQDEVVGRIVASLSGKVVADVANLEDNTAPEVHPAAYEAQLRGRFFRNTMTADGFRKGIAYFEEAIEAAPDYALAYSGMASCYCLLSGHGFEMVLPHEAMPAAKKAIQKAIELDPTLAEPYAFLGITRLKYDWDWAGAEAALSKAIALNPSDTQARIFYSVFFEAMGRQDEAIAMAEEARALDPLSLAVNVNLGWQYLQSGRFSLARQIFESTRELDPQFWSVHWGLGHYHRRNGDYDRAIESFQMAVAAVGSPTLPLTALGYTYAKSGQAAQAQSVLDELIRMSEEIYVSPFSMATIYAGLGETNQAFDWLEQAYQDRSRSMVWLNVADELEPLRADPRFDALVRRVGLPQATVSN